MTTFFIVLGVGVVLATTHLIAFARGAVHGRKKQKALHDWHREVGHV